MIWMQYNPYSQTADYKYRDVNGENSAFKDLSKDQKDALDTLKKDIILQNQIENLICVLKKIEPSQHFCFVGTQKDYKDLQEGVKQLAPDGSVEKLDSPYFREADKIRETIQTACDEVQKETEALHERYPDLRSRLRFDASGIDAVLNDRTPLVFMGEGSVGKSSVINALIGAEVLPTGDEATTQAACEIIPADHDHYTLSYKHDGSKEEFDFECDFTEGKAAVEAKLREAFDGEIRLDTDNRYTWIYQAVGLISNQENKRKEEQKEKQTHDDQEEQAHEDTFELQIGVPFKNLREIANRIVIYDTPGPNREGISNHKEVLNRALGRFEKGVAVFVTGPKELESINLRKFMKDYLKDAQKLGEILNINASIVVVNAADDSTIKGIKQAKEKRNQHLKNAKDEDAKQDFLRDQNRMIFFSSAYALGINKSPDDGWMNDTLRKKNRNKEYVDCPDDEDYLPLATEAELPFLRKQAVAAAYKEAEQRYLADPTDEENRRELIAHNSGLRALEYEIGFVVRELSICNLCKQAQDQLQVLLKAAGKGITEIGVEIEKKNREMQKQFDDRYEEIISKLFAKEQSEGQSASVLKAACDEVKKNAEKAVESNAESAPIKETINVICEKIRSQWSDIRKHPEDSIKLLILGNKGIGEILRKRNQDARNYCEQKFEEFKNKCINVVYESESLNSQEKTALEQCMRQWRVVKYRGQDTKIEKEKVYKKFLFIIDIPDKRKSAEEAGRTIIRLLANHRTDITNNIIKSFEESCKQAENQFFTEKKIKAVNPYLMELSDQIQKLETKKEACNSFRETVNRALGRTKDLTSAQERKETHK